VNVRRAEILSPDAQALIAELNAELSVEYPEPGATRCRLDPNEVANGEGAFFVAFDADQPVGCGAVRRIGEGDGEINRMYVVPARRGLGIGHLILYAIEREARQLGLRRLVLETGVRQAQAIALYEGAGYSKIPPFGEYMDSPVSICMAKEL
jgi:GNAT superfamily N-acetyltransferase